MPKPKSLLKFQDDILTELTINPPPPYVLSISIGFLKQSKESLVLELADNKTLLDVLQDMSNTITNCVMHGMPMPNILLKKDYNGKAEETIYLYTKEHYKPVAEIISLPQVA